MPYVEFDGVNQYLDRADGGAANWADITGLETEIQASQRGLTLGAWVNFDLVAGALNFERIIGKDNPLGQRAYMVYRNALAGIRFLVSQNGAATFTVDSVTVPGASAWYFVAGRFEPSTRISIFVNDERTDNAIAIPASIFDSGVVFTVGAQGTPANYLDGRTSMCFLCASALSDALILSLYNQTRAMYGR